MGDPVKLTPASAGHVYSLLRHDCWGYFLLDGGMDGQDLQPASEL